MDIELQFDESLTKVNENISLIQIMGSPLELTPFYLLHISKSKKALSLLNLVGVRESFLCFVHQEINSAKYTALKFRKILLKL